MALTSSFVQPVWLEVEILALYLVAIFDTVDWCLAARVFSIDVSAYQCRSPRRQTSVANRQ